MKTKVLRKVKKTKIHFIAHHYKTVTAVNLDQEENGSRLNEIERDGFY